MKISVSFALITIIAVEASAPWLIRIFTNEAASVAAGVLNLRIEIIGQIFYAVFIVYHALPTGAGHTWVVFLSSFVNCACNIVQQIFRAYRHIRRLYDSAQLVYNSRLYLRKIKHMEKKPFKGKSMLKKHRMRFKHPVFF